MGAIGIDIGTFETRVAHCQRGQLRLLPLGLGDNKRFACASRLLVDEEMLVFGDLAVQLAGLSRQSLWTPNRFAVGDSKFRHVDVFDRWWTPELVIAAVLRALMDASRNLIGRAIEHALIAVPASFSTVARDSLCRAVQLAGIDQLSIIDEFHAVLIGQDVPLDGSSHLIIDWGHAGLKMGVVSTSPLGLRTSMCRMAPEAGGVRVIESLASILRKQLGDPVRGAHQEIIMGGSWEVLACRALREMIFESTFGPRFADFVDGKFTQVVATSELVSGLVRMVVDAGMTQISDFLDRVESNVGAFASIQLFGGVLDLPGVRDSILQHRAFAKIFHLFVEAPTTAVVLGAVRHAERDSGGMSFRASRAFAQSESEYEFGVRDMDTTNGTVAYSPLVPVGCILPCQVSVPLPSLQPGQQDWVFDLARRKNAASLLEEVGRWGIRFGADQDDSVQWMAEVTIGTNYMAQVRVVDTVTGREAECRFLSGMPENNRASKIDIEFLASFDIYTRSAAEPDKGLYRSSVGSRQRQTGRR